MERLGEDTAVQDNGDSVHWQDFNVRFQFGVHFTRGLFDASNRTLIDTVTRLEPDRVHRCIVYYDDGLTAAFPDLPAKIEAYAAAHADGMELIMPPAPVVGGEKIKSDLHYVESLQQQLYDHHVDRHSYVIAIGGGAVLDAIGLVAATTHRGIRHIRIPTTVLSQNDRVGVKNGVNLFGSKNFVGTFAPPFAVLNDYDFIERLPVRDKIAGMAEAVKVALIRDGAFFEWLERHADDLATFEQTAMRTMIRRCAELHMRQIGHGGDLFETERPPPTMAIGRPTNSSP